MKKSPARAKDKIRRTKRRYSRELRNQNWKHHDSVARTFESKNNIEIKITRHRFMENGWIWEGILLKDAF